MKPSKPFLRQQCDALAARSGDSHRHNFHSFVSLPFLGLHQSSISPDNGEEWQERTVFVILFQWISEFCFFCGWFVQKYLHPKMRNVNFENLCNFSAFLKRKSTFKDIFFDLGVKFLIYCDNFRLKNGQKAKKSDKLCGKSLKISSAKFSKGEIFCVCSEFEQVFFCLSRRKLIYWWAMMSDRKIDTKLSKNN